MAWFTAKEWKNRLVEFAGRRSLKNVSTNETTVYDVTRNEGQVSQEGDSFSATTMNDLEQRISDAFAEAEEANTQLSSEMGNNFVNASFMTLSELFLHEPDYNFPFTFSINWNSAIAPDDNITVGLGTRGFLFAVSYSGKLYMCTNPEVGWVNLGNATFSMTWRHNAQANVVAGLYSSIDLPGNYDTLQVTPKTVSPSNTNIAFKVNGETKQTITSAGATIDLSQYNADIIKLEIYDPYNSRVQVIADITLS